MKITSNNILLKLFVFSFLQKEEYRNSCFGQRIKEGKCRQTLFVARLFSPAGRRVLIAVASSRILTRRGFALTRQLEIRLSYSPSLTTFRVSTSNLSRCVVRLFGKNVEAVSFLPDDTVEIQGITELFNCAGRTVVNERRRQVERKGKKGTTTLGFSRGDA